MTTLGATSSTVTIGTAAAAATGDFATAAQGTKADNASVKRARFRSGQPYGPLYASETTTAYGANALLVVPFYVDTTTTFNTIGIVVTGTTGTTLRLGIYRDNGSGLPSALVLDAGTVASTTAGFKSIAISQQLTPDLYWLGVVAQGSTCTVATIVGHIEPLPLSGSAVATNGCSMDSVSGALASTFVSSGQVAYAPKVLLIAA